VANEPLRLDENELYSPKVEAYLEEQAMLRRPIPEAETQSLLTRILFSSYFYLGLASGAGGFLAWGILEPFIDDREFGHEPLLIGLLVFPTVAAMVGLFLGSAEGLMCRNIRRAAICAIVGLAVGFGGGLVALIPTVIVFALMSHLSDAFARQGQMRTGISLLIYMSGRATAWAVAALPAGLGQGIALREKKVILNGLVGAALGGLVGGIMFDPLYFLLNRPDTAAASRAVGFTVIGVMVGIFVGFVEQWTKTAWLLMKAGALAGKQFVLYHTPTVLGSSPKADIYLFKDAAIEPRHALIHNRGGRYEIEDCDTPDGTYVNGIPVQKQFLQSGDQIVLGKTVLEFVLKDA
jgi:Inner membrane component of T3SS, cytoplasmic domain